MPYTLNPFTGNFDYYQAVSALTVLGPGSSTDRTVPTWNGTGGTLLRNNSNTGITSGGQLYCTGAGASSLFFGIGSIAAGIESTAIGTSANASANYSTAIGATAAAGITGTSLGRGANAASQSVAIGYASVCASAGSVTAGYGAADGGTNSVAIGYLTGGGTYAVAVGYQAQSSASYSVCIGAAATSYFDYGIAIGTGAITTGGISIGYLATDGGDATSMAIGHQTTIDSTTACTAIGHSTYSQGDGVYIGGQIYNFNIDSILIGNNMSNYDKHMIVIGNSPISPSGGSCVFIGAEINCQGADSVGIGPGIAMDTGFNVAIGAGSTVAPGFGKSTLVGRGTYAASQFCVGIGYNTTLSGDSATAIGATATAATLGVAVGGAATSVANTVAVGYGATHRGTGGVVIGKGSTTNITGTGVVVVVGSNYTLGASSAQQILIGDSVTTTSSNNNSFIVGGSTCSINTVLIGNGLTSGTPAAVTYKNTDATGTNIAGSGLTISAGQSTGSGIGGTLTLRTTAAGAGGTTLRTPTDRVTITGAGVSTINPGYTSGAHTDIRGVSSNSLVYCDATNNVVGIFTATPTTTDTPRLHINGLTVSSSGIKFQTAAATGTQTTVTLDSYIQSTEQDLGTLTWTGTTAPTVGNKKYRWVRIGKQVTFWCRIDTTVSGLAVSQVDFALPGDCPTPAAFTGCGNSEFNIIGAGDMGTGEGATPTGGGVSVLGKDGGGAWRVYISATSVAVGAVWGQITYFV